MTVPAEAFNSFATITIDVTGDEKRFIVDAPVRGTGRRIGVVDHRRARAWSLLERLTMNSTDELDINSDELDEARALGLVLPLPNMPGHVPSVFSRESSLIESGDEIAIPDRALTEEPWFTSPEAQSWWKRAPIDAPDELRWHHDDARGVRWPCRPGPANRDVRRDEDAFRHPDVRGSLRESGHAIVHNLVPRPISDALEAYCASLVREGFMERDIDEMRWKRHNDPVTAWLHHQLTPLLQSVIPEPVKPSYAFLVSYMPGATLVKHVDREQCEYTVSISLGQTPRVSSEEAWPLHIELASLRTVSVRLGIGDAVIFRGRELPHFRHALAESEAVRALFLHYVPEGFDGSLD